MRSHCPKTCFLGALVLLLSACGESQGTAESPKEMPPKPIAWMSVEEGRFEQIRRLPGILRAAESADLSFEVGGKVESMEASLGDRVTKGKVLAQLDKSSYRLNLQAAQGQLAEAEALLLEAKSAYNRQKDLFESGWVAEASLDDAKASLDTAQSSVETARAGLKLAGKDLKDTRLRAPYNGQITSRLVEPSQQVNVGQTVYTIEGEGGLEASVTIPETVIGALALGDGFVTSYPAIPGLEIDAVVTEIGALALNANAFPVTLRLTETDSRLRAGMSTEIDFVFQSRNLDEQERSAVFRLPPTALLPGEGKRSYVFVYQPESQRLEKREVIVENLFNNEVIVSEGINAGELIATAGVSFLYDQQEVRLLGVGPRRYN